MGTVTINKRTKMDKCCKREEGNHTTMKTERFKQKGGNLLWIRRNKMIRWQTTYHRCNIFKNRIDKYLVKAGYT